MALVTNKNRELSKEKSPITIRMQCAETIYRGALCEHGTGETVRNATGVTGFVGVASQYGEVGDFINLEIGQVEYFRLSITVNKSINGIKIYATDSNTFTATPNSCFVGVLMDVIEPNLVKVWVLPNL